MTDTDAHRILVPVDVLGSQAVPDTLIDAFASIPIVLLGYYETPDQTAPEQARAQHATPMREELAQLERSFESAGCTVSTRLAFTPNRFRSFERVAVEEGCDGILVLNPSPDLERVLVAIRGDANLGYISSLVTTVLAGTDMTVTLLHVAKDEEARLQAEEHLAIVAVHLAKHGIDRQRTELRVVDGRPTDVILAAAEDHDLLVIGESRPSIRNRIFRDRAERLARRSLDPVLVIRGEYLERSNGNS